MRAKRHLARLPVLCLSFALSVAAQVDSAALHAKFRTPLDWDLANDHAALFNVLIEAGGEQISVPGFTGEFRD